MKPWFEKELAEADILKFPEPKGKVIRMPNVQEYPDFITGVSDLQAKQKDGTISQESYDKLYTELIHRFMKKESFETPWFIKEAPADTGIMSLPQVSDIRDQVEKAIAQMDLSDKDNVELLRKMYSVLKTTGIQDRAQKIFSKDEDNTGAVLQAVGRSFLDIANQQPDEANSFLNNFEQNPNVVDIKALTGLPGQIKSTSDLFIGDFAKKFGTGLIKLQGNKFKSGYVGPGEIALSCLSSQIKLGVEDSGGDIVINGKGVEVKGNEGRLFDKGQVSFSNTQSFLKRTNMAGNINLNLSVEDLSRLDPELADIDPATDRDTSDKLKQFKGKKGDISSDQTNWIDKTQGWYDGFLKALVTDWYGPQWAKYSRELSSRMGTGNSFKGLWLQLQFARYKEIAQHNGIILIGLERFVFAQKGMDLSKNIDSWGTAYSPKVSQPRELSIQLKI